MLELEHVRARRLARRAQHHRRRRRLRLAVPPYGLLLVLVRAVARRGQLRLRLRLGGLLVPAAVVVRRRGRPRRGEEGAGGVRCRVDERGQVVGVVEHQVVEEGQRVAALHAHGHGVRRRRHLLLPSLARQVFVDHLTHSPFVLHATQTQHCTLKTTSMAPSIHPSIHPSRVTSPWPRGGGCAAGCPRGGTRA
uniref:Uncharacterized protein n=1 Tax=Zea mays TaxID=4577 RepID=C0P877_MAIZE|nr:unknown [Zea mays]